MARYDDLLRVHREARLASLRYFEEHRRFASELARHFERYLAVPPGRFRLDPSDADTSGFQDDHWFHLRFTIEFPDYDGHPSGTDLGIIWRIGRDEDGWLVKTSSGAQETRLEPD